MGTLKTAFQAFNDRLYDPGNLTDENIRRNRDMADRLLQQVSNPQIQHKNQGYAVLAQALNANIFRQRSEKGQEALTAQRGQEMGRFLQGLNLDEGQRSVIQNAPQDVRSGLAGAVAQHQLTAKPDKIDLSPFAEEFRDYKADGGVRGWEDYLKFRQPQGTQITNTQNAGGPPNSSILGNKDALGFAERNRDEAGQAWTQYTATTKALGFLNAPEGIFSGMGAEIKENTARLFRLMSDQDSTPEMFKTMFEKLRNTEGYDAQGGVLVGSIIRLFGSGTGLSDADREYAAAISGAMRGKSAAGLNTILTNIQNATRAELNLYNRGLDAYETAGIVDAKNFFPPFDFGQADDDISARADALMFERYGQR